MKAGPEFRVYRIPAGVPEGVRTGVGYLGARHLTTGAYALEECVSRVFRKLRACTVRLVGTIVVACAPTAPPSALRELNFVFMYKVRQDSQHKV